MNPGPVEIFHQNKINSAAAEIILCYGDRSAWHMTWLVPLTLATVVAYVIFQPVIWVERQIMKSRR